MNTGPMPAVPTVDQCVDRMMKSRPRAREDLLARGKFGHIGESCSGPLHPAVTVTAKGLEVERPTAEQWACKVTWHRYCREHGYPRGDDTGYPPRPVSAGWPPTILVTWATLTERLQREAAGQLDMFYSSILSGLRNSSRRVSNSRP